MPNGNPKLGQIPTGRRAPPVKDDGFIEFRFSDWADGEFSFEIELAGNFSNPRNRVALRYFGGNAWEDRA